MFCLRARKDSTDVIGFISGFYLVGISCAKPVEAGRVANNIGRTQSLGFHAVFLFAW